MAFRGVFDPHPLQPTQYGLLSIARLTEILKQEADSDREEHWVRGYSHIFESNPTVRLLGDSATAHVINDATGTPRFIDVKAFWLEVEDLATGLNANKDDRRSKIVRQLEAGTQKSIEHEFMHGYAARTDNNDNQYLTKPGVTIVNAGALYQMQEGLGFLEYEIAQSPLGEQGVIHMTRDMAALLGSQWILERPDATGKPHLETTNGTPVVVGSGYDGSGPKAPLFSAAVSAEGVATIVTSTAHGLALNDKVTFTDVQDALNPLHQATKLDDALSYTVTAVPSSTTFTISVNLTDIPEFTTRRIAGYAYFSADQDHKWMYATGLVDVNLGKIEVTTEKPGDGWDVVNNDNTLLLKAIRPAAVHHDPTIHAAVKVQVHQ